MNYRSSYVMDLTTTIPPNLLCHDLMHHIHHHFFAGNLCWIIVNIQSEVLLCQGFNNTSLLTGASY